MLITWPPGSTALWKAYLVIGQFAGSDVVRDYASSKVPGMADLRSGIGVESKLVISMLY